MYVYEITIVKERIVNLGGSGGVRDTGGVGGRIQKG